MSQPTSDPQEAGLVPAEGWHVLHLFYRVRRDRLSQLPDDRRREGCRQLAALLDPQSDDAPERLQTFLVPGHKADLGVLLMGPDPIQLARIEQGVQASALGGVLLRTYSFVSVTEVSEYVPTVEQYAARLREEGEDPDSPAFHTKVKSYEAREEKMRQQRLYPALPSWPVLCFYPMSKKREVGENWYALEFADRMQLMTDHGRVGQTFAGKVLQVITASTGLDDWEWGVTLWARRPDFLKEIVYTMRFDEASARYALFGPFYVGYLFPAPQLLEQLRLV
ncbi:MAG: hydrogen peroxide-dependent heme synthase [Pirellulales bacterium]